MRTAVPEQVLQIIDDLDARENVPLTRLTILRKWFEYPGRLSRFGLWVARRAAGRKGKTKGGDGALLDEARVLLGPASTRASFFAQPDRAAAEDLHARMKAAQNEFQHQDSGPVRLIRCRPLLLVEQGLEVHLWHAASPSHGQQLAADWARNDHPRHGIGLSGPSRGKLQELVRFMFTTEALEDDEK